MSSSKKAFITGCAGFAGKYLAGYLAGQGWRVYGTDRWPSCDCRDVEYHEGDILDTAAIAQMLFSIRPERIFHLAGVSFPSDADKSPRQALDINIMGAASILDAAHQACPSSRILLVGSSKQYSDAAAVDAISEETPCSPTSFYGISKYAAECIGVQFVRQYGMDIRFTRSFNHTGPGQSPRFVCSDWTKQVVAIELGKADARDARVRVGDTGPAIDFTDVRDVVRAYHLILENGCAGEAYNVCSGRAVPLKDLLSEIVRKASRKIVIEQDHTRDRLHKTGVKTIGDHSKLTRATGWQPEIPLSKTLDDLYRWWSASLSPAAVK
ncbi:MAG: GDP-mannose 4,6-dehydratase [Chitinispirillaceae bacterium]|jgi:GDP-4-dehydro-6-deoxy-D-mannose reductase